ncbi:hypothetical protein AMYX_24600 [Anaeromyxobacter diazotrophicus]|uniref:Uncharacterized protein n=1 Tax=Anaeromyxobacter diazotrophicus TaxID=2590199 RepID=A0A7I9VNM1_9BACT|nr:hypothetical protein AMYX_24600 [Anaeromyxobacter diazotrophicus]
MDGRLLQVIERAVAIDPAGLHDEVHCSGHGDILERVPFHGHHVGLLAWPLAGFQERLVLSLAASIGIALGRGFESAGPLILVGGPNRLIRRT